MPYTTLVDAWTLQERLGDPAWVLLDCRFDLARPAAGREAYRAGHIPGARYADLDADLAAPIGPDTGRHPLPDPDVFAAWLGRQGVGPDSQVVAYDAQGSAIAARAWWLLRWLGHQRVAVLDGGFEAWRRGGFALQRDLPQPAPAGAYPYRLDDTLHVDAAAIVDATRGGTLRLLDARAPERFRGEHEPLDSVAGHVPGAINHPFQRDLGADGRFRDAAELREQLTRDLGPATATDTVCMCGSGVTACHTLLALEIAGLRGARLYPGSWSQWIRDPRRPIATGD